MSGLNAGPGGVKYGKVIISPAITLPDIPAKPLLWRRPIARWALAAGLAMASTFLVCSVSMMRLLPTSYVRRRRKVASLTARYEQMSKIDNMLSTSTSSLATQMQDFFTSLQTLVSNAEDPAARQALIGKSEGLVNQFKTTDQYLRDQDKQVNIAIGASVDQINNYAKQIASLNDQISRLTGVGAGASPNNLLDQRDQLGE